MSGNVFEWALDYTGTPPPQCDNCAVLTEAADHVNVGGSFRSSTRSLANAGPATFETAPRAYEFGVRCARTP